MIATHSKLILSIIGIFFGLIVTNAQSTQPLKTADLERLVSTKISLDKEGAFNDRYTIIIFQGENQAANAAKSKYDGLELRWKSELRYDAPDFKVWIGKYRSRLEADRALLEVQKEFPNAKVLKP